MAQYKRKEGLGRLCSIKFQNEEDLSALKNQILAVLTKKKYTNFWVKMCIYPTPPPWVGFERESIFNQSAAGLNSEFPFS